jgi:AMP nucleosidase
MHFSFADTTMSKAACPRAPHADARCVRPARPGSHGRRHRQRHLAPQPGEAQPLSLFTAPRVDYSLHRLRHYTGTAPEWFQNFVLFTNYQFYIDEFIRLGHAEMAKEDSEYIAFVEPGNVVTRRTGLPPSPATSWAPRRRACRRCRPTTWCAPTTAASPWSTSAWARPTPRPSPTTSPCCARMPG